jgi:hypothetical protein
MTSHHHCASPGPPGPTCRFLHRFLAPRCLVKSKFAFFGTRHYIAPYLTKELIRMPSVVTILISCILIIPPCLSHIHNTYTISRRCLPCARATRVLSGTSLSGTRERARGRLLKRAAPTDAHGPAEPPGYLQFHQRWRTARAMPAAAQTIIWP